MHLKDKVAVKMHEMALHDLAKVTLDTTARLMTRRTEPHVKLH
jgi:NADH dehydrogenase